MQVFTHVNIGFSFYSFVWTIIHRNHQVVRFSQVRFLAFVALGAVISSLTIPFVLVDDHDDLQGLSYSGKYKKANRACALALWFYSTGFVCTFAPLFTKTWRLLCICRAHSKLRAAHITNSTLFAIIAALLVVDWTILGLWMMHKPFNYVRQVEIGDEFGNPIRSAGQCQSDQAQGYYIALFSFHFIVLLYGNYLCYQVRNVDIAFSEGKFVAIAMISNLQVLALGLPVLAIVSNNPVSTVFVRTGIVFFNDFSVLLMIFIPKMMALNRDLSSLLVMPSVKIVPAISTPDKSQSNNVHGKGSPPK